MALLTRPIPYEDGAAQLEGVLTFNDGIETRLPGLLLVHGGAGLDTHAREQSARYADLGFVVFAVDMFGRDVAGNRERVVASLLEMRDNPDLLVRRASAGISALEGCPEANSCLAAVGFCFGGMTVLALARAGVNLGGVISVHGSLRTARPATAGSVIGRVLVCHGAADPHVPMADVTSLVDEMSGAGADFQVLIFGRALHGFTHRQATFGATPGVAYDELADRRSFNAARQFLADLMS